MKRQRIKIPNLPSTIIKQPNGSYRDMKTLTWYTLETLQRIYGEKEKVSEIKEVKPHWTNNYDNY